MTEDSETQGFSLSSMFSSGEMQEDIEVSHSMRVLMHAAEAILEAVGEDQDREGLRETPARVARALGDLTHGYHDDPTDWWKTFDAEGADQMICQWDIPLYSLCEHHILPFVGYAHIGYIPRDDICGLSKFKRVVDLYARRLQVQERLTREISEFVDSHLKPRGVIVVIEAEHLCMTIRGVQTPGTLTTTSAVAGDFLDPAEGSREEFLRLMQARRPR